MSRKVIYVAWVKLTEKYAQDYYVNYLIENGVEVEYWDVVALLRQQHNEVGELDADHLRVLKSYDEFENLVQLKENADAVYVMLITPGWQTRFPFQFLSKYKRKMVVIEWGLTPVALADSKTKRALTKCITDPFGFFRLLFDLLFFIVYKKLKLIRPFDIAFVAGSLISEGQVYAKKIIPFNICDYGHYVRVKSNNNCFVKGRYAVFLDINLPFHSDLALNDMDVLNPNRYYQSLNRFFSLLEQRYELKIVIAAHPQTDADAELFGRRQVFSLSTAELVKDADFVLTHFSTALSYAVLNTKPCVFIYTDEIETLYAQTVLKEIRAQADFFESVAYNVDQIFDVSQLVIKAPNSIIYDDYKYSFLTSKVSENSLSEDIFLQEIKSIN